MLTAVEPLVYQLKVVLKGISSSDLATDSGHPVKELPQESIDYTEDAMCSSASSTGFSNRSR